MYNKTLSALLTSALLISCTPEVEDDNKAPVSKYTVNNNLLIASSTDDSNSGLKYEWSVGGTSVSTENYLDISGFPAGSLVILKTTDSQGLFNETIYMIPGVGSQTTTETNTDNTSETQTETNTDDTSETLTQTNTQSDTDTQTKTVTNTQSDTNTNTELPINLPPVAKFTIAATDLTVMVNASTSSDPEMFNLTYAWEFYNANGQLVKTDDTPSSSFTFANAGLMNVKLTVTDSEGQLDELSKTIDIIVDTNTQTQTDDSIGDCSDNTLDFCADFEDQQLPNALSAANNYSFDNIGYNSDYSVKVTAANSSNPGFFQIVPPAADFWTRVFMRSSGDSAGNGWGGDDEGFARAHGVLLKGVEGNAQMRVGDHRCQLEINRDGGSGHLGDDLEMTSGNYGADGTICNDTIGARMQPNEWYCLEVHFNGPESEIQVFWDNQNVEQLHVTADRTWTNEDKPPGGQYSQNADQPWGPYNYDYFAFGYESFNNNGAPNISFWYDNVAVSTQRVGCGGDYTINETLDESTKLQPTSNGYPYTESTGGNTDTETMTDTDTETDTDTDTEVAPADLIKYDTFEDSTVGNVPNGWGVWADYTTKLNVTKESGIEVVSTGGINNSKALKVTGGNNNNRKLAMFKLPNNIDKVYVKTQVKFSTEVGGRSQNESNHNHFFALKNESTNNELRFGEIKGVLGVNEWINSGDGLYPHGSEWGPNATIPTIAANQWHCMEFVLENDGSESVFEAKLNGVTVTSFSGAAFHNNNQGSKWLDGMFGFIALGWDSYGTYANEVWFDEVVIASVPVSCN